MELLAHPIQDLVHVCGRRIPSIFALSIKPTECELLSLISLCPTNAFRRSIRPSCSKISLFSWQGWKIFSSDPKNLAMMDVPQRPVPPMNIGLSQFCNVRAFTIEIGPQAKKFFAGCSANSKTCQAIKHFAHMDKYRATSKQAGLSLHLSYVIAA